MTADYCVIDFETRAKRELKICGVERYVECPHFDALCLGYEWPDNQRELWRRGAPAWPTRLFEHVAAGKTVVAHNAGFELAAWGELHRRDKRWPELKPEQMVDTMVLSRAMGLPGALADAAAAMRLPVRKDAEGHALMLTMCKPRKPRKGELGEGPYWNEEPDKLERLAQYCLVDIEVQHALFKKLPRLLAREQDLWALCERINSRGLPIDKPNAEVAADLVVSEAETLSSQFRQFTNGKVTSGNERNKILEWLNEQGVVIGSLRKTDVQRLLDDPKALENKDTAKAVLLLRKEAAKASNAKLKAMLNSACRDNRARGLFGFHATNTARFAGRRVQTQNLPRTPKHFKPKDAERVIGSLKSPTLLRLFYGSVMDSVSWSLRGFIKARPGHRLIACDYSNIEGRVLAWLAGEEWKLDAYRAFDAGEGPDLYNVTAAGILQKPVDQITEDERQVMGKVPELALGFQGGVGAFTAMGANYGVTIVADRADAPANAKYVLTDWEADDIKTKWREKNPAIQNLWYRSGDAVRDAIENPGIVTEAGRLKYRVKGDFLLCLLPSGRCMSYAYPSIKYMTTTWYEREVEKLEKALEGLAEEVHTDEGAREYGAVRDILDELKANPDKRDQITFWGINSKSKNKKWGLCRAYGGLLVENATQATARDKMVAAFPKLEAAGYPIVMHCHDEITCEVPNGFGSLNEMASIMCADNGWEHGLPVVAAGWEGDRYRKG